MILLLSGEGATDLGCCNNTQGDCSDSDFSIGPIGVLIDKLMEPKIGYSMPTVPGAVRYISKYKLMELAAKRKSNKRTVILRGSNREHETSFFYANALDFGLAALEIQESGHDVVAVFFRDCDRMRSDPKHLWEIKFKSVSDGFQRAGFLHGVPMIANPKSEAWLLCAAKTSPFEHCAILEELSGNDDSANPAKEQLAEMLGGARSVVEMNEWLADLNFDVAGACEMPSFAKFHHRLQEVVRSITGVP
jgi:hypothetical protein